MRCSGWSSLAISVCSALVLAGSAAAHVVATPAFIPSGSSDSITFSGPNERDEPMTSFSVKAPPGLEIEHAHEVAGWSESLDSATATWSGGALAPGADTTFGVTLKADAQPGLLELTVDQGYVDGGVVTWRVAITVTPPEESPSQNLALAGVVGLIGVLLVVAVAMLGWRRRA